jgi:hypothetical protein
VPLNPPPGYRKARICGKSPSPSKVKETQPPVDCPKQNQKMVDQNRDYYKALKEEELQKAEKHLKQQGAPDPVSKMKNNPVTSEETLPPPSSTFTEMQDRAKEAPIDDDSSAEDLFFAGIASKGSGSHSVPNSLPEAFDGPDAEQWHAALQEELQNLLDNNVYEIVPIPEGVKPITSKPVMQIKFDQNGDIKCFKLQIAVWGFVQVEGVDYKEVFTPVANLESICIILALAAKYDLELDQMDISTAYLNGELEEVLYLSPPEGFAIPDGYCWKLNWALYGVKQAGRTWNITLDKKLKSLGFQHLNAETCLYVYQDHKDQLCFLVVYVDNILLAATTWAFMNTIKEKLHGAFKIWDLGKPATSLAWWSDMIAPIKAYTSHKNNT